MRVKGWSVFILSTLISFWPGPLIWTQANVGNSEVEISAEWLRSIEAQLSSPDSVGKLDVFDQLAFGKGRFIRVDGRSRKNAVLILDGEGKSEVHLFDLPKLDLKVLSSQKEYYFSGILSKIDSDPQSGTEVTINYANVSEVAGRFYSREAREFAKRTVELEKRNQVIRGKGEEPQTTLAAKSSEATQPPIPAAETEKSVSNNSSTVPPVQPQPRSESKSSKPPDTTDDTDQSPRNRPVLMRRTRNQTDPATAEGPPQASSDAPAEPVHISHQPEDDVVIYRKRDGNAAPVSPGQSSEVHRSSSETLDRPVLRRTAASSEPAQEVDGMVLIPEGVVAMGTEDAGEGAKPVHRVLVKGFYIEKYEVTNSEYKEFCEATGHQVPPYWHDKTYPRDQEKYPVVQVSWFDAVAYASWSGKRLPTEAEWERAAKGPNSYRYAYGNAYDPQKATTGSQEMQAADSHPANEFGLFEMTGNASEWTSSLYLPYPYSASDGREDPKAIGPRVVRGGDFTSNERTALCSAREKELPDHGSPRLGFRCARNAN